MANKRLSPHEIEEMKNMVVKGVYPEDIAKHFNIAVSSVHNYKTRFKEQGLEFPSVKGKRPASAIKPVDTLRNKEIRTSEKSERKKSNILGVINQNTHDHYKFIVNGVSIEIGSGAKYVNIGKDSMEIHF